MKYCVEVTISKVDTHTDGPRGGGRGDMCPYLRVPRPRPRPRARPAGVRDRDRALVRQGVECRKDRWCFLYLNFNFKIQKDFFITQRIKPPALVIPKHQSSGILPTLSPLHLPCIHPRWHGPRADLESALHLRRSRGRCDLDSRRSCWAAGRW